MRDMRQSRSRRKTRRVLAEDVRELGAAPSRLSLWDARAILGAPRADRFQDAE